MQVTKCLDESDQMLTTDTHKVSQISSARTPKRFSSLGRQKLAGLPSTPKGVLKTQGICTTLWYFPEIHAGSNLCPSSLVSTFHQRQPEVCKRLCWKVEFARHISPQWVKMTADVLCQKYVNPHYVQTFILSSKV